MFLSGAFRFLYFLFVSFLLCLSKLFQALSVWFFNSHIRGIYETFQMMEGSSPGFI
jgi:hypothetical protein